MAKRKLPDALRANADKLKKGESLSKSTSKKKPAKKTTRRSK